MAETKNLYELRLREFYKNYSHKTTPVQFRVPTYLVEAFKEQRKRGCRTTNSMIFNEALHFALLGPHPFEEPIDGLRDCFELYTQRNLERRDMLKNLVEKVCDANGIKVKFD